MIYLNVLFVGTVFLSTAVAWPTWQAGSNGVQWAEYCDFSGNDLYSKPSTGAQCGDLCAADSNCNYFTWTNYNNGTCWLKGGSNLQPVQYTNDYSVCGYVQRWPAWNAGSNGVQWAEYCDFSGNNLYSKPSTGAQCGDLCAADAACNYFTWTQYNSGTCWMKSGSNLQPIQYTSGYSVCGYIKNKSGGGGGSPYTGPTLHIKNNCPFDIWPGIQGSTLVADGGFYLATGQTKDVQVPDGWTAGRIWARTGCDSNMNCETGFCGNKVGCGGLGGAPPVSLAEFTLYGAGGQDFYDVSLVDGYNLAVFIEPVAGTYTTNGGTYDCKRAGGCVQNLNQVAPTELQVNKNGHVVSVYSACMKFNTDQYCCRGAYGTPQACNPATWPVNYASIFKQACPTAYSYAYDDKTSTFLCRGANGRKSPDYNVQFC